MQQTTIHNWATGEARTLAQLDATQRMRVDRNWQSELPPPVGWHLQMPRYRAKEGVRPPMLDRLRFEPPVTQYDDGRCWQYAERPIKQGEVVETDCWPHALFEPLNYAAERVLDYFLTREKSRMTQKPFIDGKVKLDDGLSFDVIAHHQEQAVKNAPRDRVHVFRR